MRSIYLYLPHLVAAYRQSLDKLQKPIPAEPWFCAPWECELKPRCFTDFRPQFNPQQSLSGIVLGSHRGWRREEVEDHESFAPFGYLDRRVYFKVRLKEGANFFININTDANQSTLEVLKLYFEYLKSINQLLIKLNLNSLVCSL